MGEFDAWLTALHNGESLDLKPWEKVTLLEHLAQTTGDLVEHTANLLDAPIPTFRLDDVFALAVQSGNEQIAIAVLDAGATATGLDGAAAAGMAVLCARLVAGGVRVNRLYQSALAPIHHAGRSDNPHATCAVLVDACADLTVRTPDGRLAWELAPSLAGELTDRVGAQGPTWFREAQREGIDHYVFVDDDAMFGFNPNDVQTPIWTGDEAEGFGWPNTAAQAREMLDDRRLLRSDLEWFLPFLDKLAAHEDFSLDDLGARAGVPRRRTSWR